jgi:hypothetical protein
MDDARRELYLRALALPGALIAARIASAVTPGAVRMISMWVHESGHAVAAWLTGFAAFPGPWFTPIDLERSLMVTLVLAGALAAGAYYAWQIQRWFWVATAGVVLMVALAGAFAVHPIRARELFTFAGDGGCFVLGTALMLTMYARADHQLREERLRWVCLAVGALAFMDARATWFGDVGSLPLGEDDRGLSDASVLTEAHGWPLELLVGRYQQLAVACFIVLAVAWILGLVQAVSESRGTSASTPSSFPRSRRTASTR